MPSVAFPSKSKLETRLEFAVVLGNSSSITVLAFDVILTWFYLDLGRVV